MPITNRIRQHYRPMRLRSLWIIDRWFIAPILFPRGPQYRSAKLLGLFLRGLCPRFPSETGKRLGGCANWHSVRPPPAPKAHREERNVRKWQLDTYCVSTNCGGRVHRGVVLGFSEAPGATLGGLGGAGATRASFSPHSFPTREKKGCYDGPINNPKRT